jgi:CheY-like chemotaxis protein
MATCKDLTGQYWILINDILDLSKIEAGKIVLESVEFSLLHCINDIVMMQKYVMYEKGLHLVVDIAEDMPSVLKGDQLRIKQILHNLLGNAVKFTAQGTVTVSASLVEQHDNCVLARITVRDTGIGISAEALETVFKPFIQEDGSITRTYGGTGLGLTISRCLTELLGGSITVESTPGIGSSFTVTLPLVRAADAAMAVEPADHVVVRWDGSPLRVLLVDDDPINILFGKALLNKTGHDVTVAHNGRECLAVLAQHPFDLVLMDIQMPLMNGEEALCEIRRKESGTAVHQKIIALTAYSMQGEQTKFLGEGFDGYASKPLIIQELMDEMRRVMEESFPVGCGSNVKPGGFL